MQSPASENHLGKGIENTTEKHQKSYEKLPRSAVLRYEWKSADFDSIFDPKINQNPSKIMKKRGPNTHLKIDCIFYRCPGWCHNYFHFQ